MKIGSINDPAKNIYTEIDRIISGGFDYIDFAYEPPLKDLDIDKIRTKIELAGLEVIGHSNPTLPAIYPVKEIRYACLNQIIESLEVFFKLGAKMFTIHPFYHPYKNEYEHLILANIDFFNQIVPIAKRMNMVMMLENYLYPFDQVGVFKRIIKNVKDLKIHLDIGHLNIGGNPVQSADNFFNEFGDLIIHLHMHDNKGTADEHLPFFCGNINWRKIIDIIKKNNYKKTITLEIFTDDSHYLNYSHRVIRKMLA